MHLKSRSCLDTDVSYRVLNLQPSGLSKLILATILGLPSVSSNLVDHIKRHFLAGFLGGHTCYNEWWGLCCPVSWVWLMRCSTHNAIWWGLCRRCMALVAVVGLRLPYGGAFPCSYGWGSLYGIVGISWAKGLNAPC